MLYVRQTGDIEQKSGKFRLGIINKVGGNEHMKSYEKSLPMVHRTENRYILKLRLDLKQTKI